MAIVTIGNSKGGVGKTTLSINLAAEALKRGLHVWLVDADQQGSTTGALRQRALEAREPTIASAFYPDGDTLRAQLKAQAGGFDLVLIDAGGRDSRALRVALAMSDLALIPFQPRSLDVWALEQMATLVNEVRDAGGVLPALAFLNMADIAGQDNAAAAAAVLDYPALEYLDSPIKRRKAYSNAAGAGVGVTETGEDAKAAAELEELFKAVIKRLEAKS